MRVVMSIVGFLLVLIGIVWILQGVNILMGSMMSGHIQYSILGLVVAAIGIALLWYGNRRARVTGGDDRMK